MKKVYLVSLLLFVSIVFCVSADNFSTYQRLLKNRDYKALKKHLAKWEKDEPKSAEVYVAYFNMYLSMGMESRNVISKEPPKNGDVLELHDEKTGKCVGYMGSEIFYKHDEVQKAIAALDKGLKYNPKRLDMYFGKAHVLGEIGKYKEQTKVIMKVLDLSVKYKNNWLWSFDKPFGGGAEEGEYAVLSGMQDYLANWARNLTKENMVATETVCKKLIKTYPKFVPAYNSLATMYLFKNKNNEALKLLHKARSLDKKDMIVCWNIALVYKKMGNKKKAKEFFKIIIKEGSPDMAEGAKKQMEDL